MMQWKCFQCACNPSNPPVAPSWCCPLTTKIGSASASATRSTSRSKEKLHFEQNFPPVFRTASFCNSNRGSTVLFFLFLFFCIQLISTILPASSEHCLISSRRCSDPRREVSHLGQSHCRGPAAREIYTSYLPLVHITTPPQQREMPWMHSVHLITPQREIGHHRTFEGVGVAVASEFVRAAN